jgi:hypothetical protein
MRRALCFLRNAGLVDDTHAAFAGLFGYSLV